MIILQSKFSFSVSDINYQTKDGNTALHYVIKHGDHQFI